MEKYTIDELLDVLQWARDRAAYFRAVFLAVFRKKAAFHEHFYKKG